MGALDAAARSSCAAGRTAAPGGRVADRMARWTFLGTKQQVRCYSADMRRMARSWRIVMLYWALIFLVVAIIAGLFGFGGIASASAGIAQVLFFIFLVIFVVTLVMHLVRGRRTGV